MACKRSAVRFRLAPPILSERTHGISGPMAWSLFHKDLVANSGLLIVQLSIKRGQTTAPFVGCLCSAPLDFAVFDT